MSDDARDETVLGKRAREGADAPDLAPDAVPTGDESDDDDFGPMPLPAGAPASGGAKKKRKGE
jgi:peptidylprolyl isomerase domain and WD repeat-containing protein 1